MIGRTLKTLISEKHSSTYVPIESDKSTSYEWREGVDL